MQKSLKEVTLESKWGTKNFSFCTQCITIVPATVQNRLIESGREQWKESKLGKISYKPSTIKKKTEDKSRNTGTTRTRQAGKAILAQTLSEIVELIMTSSDVIMTYHDDGSKKKGCGSFSVHGIRINGKYRAMSTLPVSSETRDNLIQLRITVLNIISIASDGNYTPKDIQEKVTFKLTNGVSRNFGIEEMVVHELGTDHFPQHLLCHTHPVLMFNPIWERWNDSSQKIEDMGLSIKEAQNKNLDRKLIADLYILKSKGGSFTKTRRSR
ncbi:unnamed protein product [Lepeophtheirus salmonis]|uniref:(salmon louse) hypothetical protein n=1 Tax=Lepeophtheirus salmonis TaxID=72036 RepID=A0A7R8CP61_LEPSM|nr:unnamed protein product [Lepeophtheirus salmonis]CAF2882885.1 unnamed protein product [Lepeophtheirus salmonis]